MPRPPRHAPEFSTLLAFAETLGEALGRGVARGLNAELSNGSLAGLSPRRRGRPPKPWNGVAVPADRRCRVDGCPRAARSKGLCSAHYQAERRRQLAR